MEQRRFLLWSGSGTLILNTYMKTYIRLLIMIVTMQIAAAQTANEPNEAMTPESLHDRAVKASEGTLGASIISEAFSSGRMELVKAAFREPRLSSDFTKYLRNMETSNFKDQIVLMLLKERWLWDEDGPQIDGSRPPPMLQIECIKVIAKRLETLNLNLNDDTLFRQLSSLESRKKIALLFAPFVEEQEKTNSEDPKLSPKDAAGVSSSPTATPPRATKRAPDMTLATQANEKPVSSTPWSIIVGSIVAALGVLWFFLKGRR
jgi:hypothetical protein